MKWEPPEKKAGASSRTPNGVIYESKYSMGQRKVKGNSDFGRGWADGVQGGAVRLRRRGTLRALATGGWSGFGALGMDGFGGLGLADFGGADFVGGGVAGTLEGAPHVPTGDGAVGAPALAESEEFLGLGHVLFAVGDGPSFFDAEVVDGENVGAAEAENQKHFDGPGADAADRDETFDEFFV